MKSVSLLLIVLLTFTTCIYSGEVSSITQIATSTPVPAANTPSKVDTNTPEPSPFFTFTELKTSPTPANSPTPTLEPEAWKSFPIIPAGLSSTAYKIFQKGQEKGLNPQAFSKVGDCNSIYPDFLTWYDLKPETIRLGQYAYMQDTLDYFAGSWGRESLAAKVGLTSTSVMAPLWADWKFCAANETPLDCEYRIHQPAFAIISFGTNDANGTVPFEPAIRKVIEHTIELGILPILATKPDNAEGDHSINRLIADLAREYELPLWNFWAALQHLPDKGMAAPEHLSYSSKISWVNFEARASLTYGWTIRNLSGLQLMHAMREFILEYESVQSPNQ